MISNYEYKNTIRFQLALPSDRFLAYYEGNVKDVVVVAEDKRKIRFPASAIRHFITQDGIYGRFEIIFDDNNKLIKVQRLSH